MSTKKKLVIANWKMYVDSPDTAKKFLLGLKRAVAKLTGVEAWVAPSFTLLPAAAAALKGSAIKAGAQAVSPEAQGAHTGSVSAAMLKAAGAHFVLVGHSERRAAGDTNEAIRQELARATEAGLVPVLCVGERERTPEGAHFTYIEEQLSSALRGMQSLLGKLVVAYEPVWAIGKSAKDAMQPGEVEETIIFIRKTLADVLGRQGGLKIPILYGGSVEPDNAQALLRDGGVGGFLVGHASAELDQFVEILKSCRK